MMKSFYAIFPLILLFTASCKDGENVNKFELGIDVQSDFNSDLVQIFIDGREIIHKQLQTNPALGVCLEDGQVMLDVREGKHQIKALINGLTTYSENFELTDDLYIGINYDPSTKAVSYAYSDTRFIYD